MKVTLLLCGVVGFALVGCGQKSTSTNSTGGTAGNSNAVSTGNPLTAPVDYLGAVAAGKTFSEKTIDLAQLTHAIQMFEVDQGRYPKSLDELVQEKLLAAIPKPPYGMKLQYNPNTGQATIVKAQ